MRPYSVLRMRQTGVTAKLLDTYPIGAGNAYSVRKLRTAYSGASLRVRRSSDNAEQDIGFNGLGNLDTSALLAFVGANSGFVTAWYDQSGNGIDVTQATASLQPRIVNAGVVDTENSRPISIWDGTDDALYSTGFTSNVLTSTKRVTSAVVERSIRTSAANEAFVAFKATGGLDFQTGYICERRTTNISNNRTRGNNTANYIGQQSADSNITALSLVHYFVNPGTPSEGMFIDGVSKTLSAAYSSGVTTIADFMSGGVGGRRIIIGNGQNNTSDTVFNRPFGGKLAEIILWDSDLSASLSSIYTEQKAYYGTP